MTPYYLQQAGTLRRIIRLSAALCFVGAAGFGSSAPASAESLEQALAAAYKYNPRIDSERARLRATDEDVAQAMAGYRPSITGNADVNYSHSSSKTNRNALLPGESARSSSTLYPSSYGVSLSQNIFDGFQTTNSVRVSEAFVRAGRETLRSVEQDVLLQAVTAYMDVVRDQAIVGLRENNVTVLSRELKATQDRFAVGEVTRTDVAQAQARRAASVSDLDLAKANLKSSRATYERVVGHPPSNLSDQQLRRKLLPKTLEEAVAIASKESPAIIGVLYQEQAQRHVVDQVRGALLPQATLEANYTNSFDNSESTEESESATVTGRLTVPFYQGGGEYARVRQAKQNHISLLQEIERARTETQEFVVSSWSQLLAAEAQLVSDKSQAEANRTALQGVREEEKVGQRTLLDVLNAEQELLDSEVQLATTRRNVVVTGYTLLNSIGRLDAANLGVADYVYEPEEYYLDVRRKWFGLSITYADGRHETMDAWSTQEQPAPAK